jgi:hypothetical protein
MLFLRGKILSPNIKGNPMKLQQLGIYIAHMIDLIRIHIVTNQLKWLTCHS